MRAGSFRFVRQESGIGTFAFVRVSIDSSAAFPHTIVAAPEVDPHLADAARFGVRYGLASRALSSEAPMVVSIDEVQYTNVDTTQMAVVFASCNAMFDALGIDPPNIVVDMAERTVRFPMFP